MNKLPIVVAVGIIGFAIFGLIAVWVASQIKRPAQKKRHNDLVVVHRFKQRRRKRMGPIAPAAPSMPASDTGDDSQWRRPGFTASVDPSFRAPMPLYEPDKPRHILIPHTPHVIVPHETIEPPKPRLSQRTQRSQPTVMIKALRIDRVPEQAPPTQKTADKYVKAGKLKV